MNAEGYVESERGCRGAARCPEGSILGVQSLGHLKCRWNEWAGNAAVGTALICMEGLRLSQAGGRACQRAGVGTALICMEGLRPISPPRSTQIRALSRNCPDLYGGIATVRLRCFSRSAESSELP
jgi:hypothetical protein